MDFFYDPLKFNKIIFQDKFYYPPQINHLIDHLSHYLKSNKQSNSPFIYLFGHNHIKTIVAYFAIIKSNKICVLVDPDIKHIELGEMMQDTPPYAMIKINKLTEEFDYKDEIEFKDNNIDVDTRQLEDVCTMVYTSAEDGFAKGAMLTKLNLISNANAGVDSDFINDEKTCCAFLPFHHLFGLQTGVLTPLSGASSFLIIDINNFKKIKKYAKDINTYKITNFYSIPMIYYLLEKIPDILSLLKNAPRFCSGGYRLSDLIRNLFQNKTNKIIYEGYGLTEASPVCSWYRPEDSLRKNSVGRAYPCCQITILDEYNNECPTAQIGEVCIKGDNVMKGYFNNTEATNRVIKNNWLHTGDFGRMDKDGYVYLTGLKKSMVKVCGRSAYFPEIERLIKKNKNVKSVKVYGEVSEIQGYTINAHVEFTNRHSNQEEILKKWCLENISHYKIPNFTSANTRNTSLKVIKLPSFSRYQTS